MSECGNPGLWDGGGVSSYWTRSQRRGGGGGQALTWTRRDRGKALVSGLTGFTPCTRGGEDFWIDTQ